MFICYFDFYDILVESVLNIVEILKHPEKIILQKHIYIQIIEMSNESLTCRFPNFCLVCYWGKIQYMRYLNKICEEISDF